MNGILTHLTILGTLFASPVLATAQLDVPFTSQAPENRWVQPWQDACEETSIFMVHRFYVGEPITQQDAINGIGSIFNMKHAIHGESLDEPVSKLADIINDFLPWSAHVVESPSLDDLKSEIDAGRPVILPFYAPALYNPYFTGEFPYHMGVLSGYDDEKQVFTVQEPGTRYGKNFQYSYSTIENAIHDFVPHRVHTGPRRVLFTSPNMGKTADYDADGDGLSKADEFLYGTIPYYVDSDADGYSDGNEVEKGFIPTRNEMKLIQEGALLIAPNSPKVYYIERGLRRHVPSEEIFFSRGWHWGMLDWISDAMMKKIPEGPPLT